MHSKTINKKDFSFFTGWKKENVDRHITFDISFKNDEIQVTNLSNSNLVIKNQSGYGINMGGHIKDFLINKKNEVLEIRTPYAAHPFFVWSNNNGGIIISDSYNYFSKYGDTTKLNKQYCALRLMGEVPGLHLPFLETKYLFPSFIYHYTNEGLSAKSVIFQTEETGASMERAFEQTDALYAEFCKQKSHVIASLTGGYDSRFYASMLRRHLKKDQLDFFYIGDYEAHLSSSVAKALNSNFSAFDAKDTIQWLRQQPLSFYGGDDFYKCSNGLWREEGLYLFNATAAVGRTLLGSLEENTGFMGMCIESANKGNGYDRSPNIKKMLDRMYIERHPDLAKFRAASTYDNITAPLLEDVYHREFTVLKNTTDRPDILSDLYIYYLVTLPKATLRNGVYAKSGRTYYPLMDERFFNAYLSVPASEKAEMGLYRYTFNKLNKKLISLPHQSMDTLKAGLSISSSGSYLQKINHKMRLKLGLSKKFKGPKRNWKDHETASLLEPIVKKHYQNIFPEIDENAWGWIYPYEIYLFGEYLNFLQSPKDITD